MNRPAVLKLLYNQIIDSFFTGQNDIIQFVTFLKFFWFVFNSHISVQYVKHSVLCQKKERKEKKS